MIKAIVNDGKVEINVDGVNKETVLTELAFLNHGILEGIAEKENLEETKLLKMLTKGTEEIIRIRNTDKKIKSHIETEETNIEEALKYAIEKTYRVIKRQGVTMKERVGNIRKIDKLGRVSIPAELRRLLHINRETLLTVEYDSILKEIRIIPLKEEN